MILFCFVFLILFNFDVHLVILYVCFYCVWFPNLFQFVPLFSLILILTTISTQFCLQHILHFCHILNLQSLPLYLMHHFDSMSDLLNANGFECIHLHQQYDGHIIDAVFSKHMEILG